jgi:endo-1,4-beta-xylanase
MDVGVPPIGVLTPENENNQAMKFAELFEIYKRYAAGPANTTANPKVIDRVSICGVRDATTAWRAGEFALLFDSEGFAKQSLIAVLDPDAFIAEHDYILSDDSIEYSVDGVYVSDMGRGDVWSGANIVLGNNASQWPWSDANEEDGKVAFVPEKDAMYRLTINYTATGTTGIRIRWLKDETNGAYTNADGVVVNDYVYLSSDIATTIPSLFNGDMVNAGSYTLVTEFKMDGSEEPEGLIGNIGIRGYMGGNAFSINWIKMEKMDTDELLFLWDPNAPLPEPEPDADDEPEPEFLPPVETTPEPTPILPPADESGGGIAALIIAIIAIVVLGGGAVAFVIIKRKKT